MTRTMANNEEVLETISFTGQSVRLLCGVVV